MITRGKPDWDAFLPEVIDRMVAGLLKDQGSS